MKNPARRLRNVRGYNSRQESKGTTDRTIGAGAPSVRAPYSLKRGVKREQQARIFAECRGSKLCLLAEDEDAEGGVEPSAEAVQAEAAVRAIHAGARHRHAAVRVRPPGILADCEDPRTLRHLIRVVVQEAGEITGGGELVAGGRQALRGLLAGLDVEVGLHPALDRPDTDALERETVLGDVGIDIPDVTRADRAVDKRDEADRLVVGNLAPHLRQARRQELFERRAVVGIGEREQFIIREIVTETQKGPCRCLVRCHDYSSFHPYGQYSQPIGQKEVQVDSQPSYNRDYGNQG